MPPAEQVGYHYWRGRLHFALAVTLQEKFRGPYEWSRLVALYSRAFDDFSTAIADDPNPDRRKVYQETWMPWSRAVLTNATHMQLAQHYARRGDFIRARGALGLVDPTPAFVQQWDEGALSAPRPDYSFLHGLISLGLGHDVNILNPLITKQVLAAAPSYAEASYAQAISETEDSDIVAQPSDSYPDDSRPLVYRAALGDLDRLLEAPPKVWPAESRAAAERVRARLLERLNAVTK
jgi:hypothetical protein